MSRVISILFHPLFLPFYLLLLLFNFDFHASIEFPLRAKLFLGMVVFITTILLPLLTNFLFMRMRLIQSWKMETREERIFPLITQAVFFYLTYYLLKQYQIPFVFTFYMLGATFLVFCALVINLFYKISLHMIAIGGIFGFFTGLALKYNLTSFTSLILIVILLSGIIGTVRIKEDSHKSSEVYSGFLVGTSMMMLLFLLA